MADVLRGNFVPRRPVKVEEAKDDLTAEFEREALRRLGGSICFVSKRGFLYGAEGPDGAAPSAPDAPPAP